MLFLIASVILSVSAFRPLDKIKGYPNPNKMDMNCIRKHCPLAMAEAMIDPVFLELGVCENRCNELYYTDTSPGKLHYQNCTTKCALTYESRAGENFLACTMNEQCVVFAPIEGHCPKPEPDANTQLTDLNGEWW